MNKDLYLNNLRVISLQILLCGFEAWRERILSQVQLQNNKIKNKKSHCQYNSKTEVNGQKELFSVQQKCT